MPKIKQCIELHAEKRDHGNRSGGDGSEKISEFPSLSPANEPGQEKELNVDEREIGTLETSNYADQDRGQDPAAGLEEATSTPGIGNNQPAERNMPAETNSQMPESAGEDIAGEPEKNRKDAGVPTFWPCRKRRGQPGGGQPP